jgi:hypothetical protein
MKVDKQECATSGATLISLSTLFSRSIIKFRETKKAIKKGSLSGATLENPCYRNKTQMTFSPDIKFIPCKPYRL